VSYIEETSSSISSFIDYFSSIFDLENSVHKVGGLSVYLTFFSGFGFSILTGVGFLTIVVGVKDCSCYFYYFSSVLSKEAFE